MTPEITQKILSYRVLLHSGRRGSKPEAEIQLVIENGTVDLRFFSDSYSIKEARVDRDEESGRLAYALDYAHDQLGNMIDILRNEGPHQFCFDEQGKEAFISTWIEQPGEGEYEIDINLSTDFSNLSHVYVVTNLLQKEQLELEAQFKEEEEE